MYYLVNAMRTLQAIGLMKNLAHDPGFPLPRVVLYELGKIPTGPVSQDISKRCIERYKAGVKYHALIEFVRREHTRAVIKAIESLVEKG